MVLCSRLDPGGSSIRDALIGGYRFRETGDFFDSAPVYEYSDVLLASTGREIIRVGRELDEAFADKVASYVFVSKHRAESGIPSLTAHFTGNFGSSEFGGNPRQVSRHSPSFLKNYMMSLASIKDRVPEKYNLTLEATHHGPTELARPSAFVEIGSSEVEWGDRDGAACVAEALVRTLSIDRKFARAAIGLGGTHYPDKFNRLILETEIALGVIAPKYALDNVDIGMVKQFVEKSEEKIQIVAVDSKGLGKHKGRILDLVRELGLELVRV